MNRREVCESLFSAKALFTAALLIMPALLFNPSTEYRVLQFIFFWFLAWLSGKKSSPVFVILIIAGIVAFNLIIPYGRVLFSIGAFKVTSGALKAGVHRAVTLEALVMLSKACVSRNLKIPGAFGGLLGESLRIFSVMADRKYRITGKNFFAGIDNLLLELSEEETPKEGIVLPHGTLCQTRTKPAGYVILGIVVVLSWLPWVGFFCG